MPDQRARINRATSTDTQPVSLADAKKQLEIAPDDDSHDCYLIEAIEAAREQFEIDTPYVTTPQEVELLLDCFPRGGLVRLPIRPVQSLVSVLYLDDDGAEQTMGVDVAALDRRGRSLVLRNGQQWPSGITQADSVVITVSAGYAQGEVPKLIKRAMCLQIGKWFEDRDMMFSVPDQQFDQAYQRLIRKMMRSTYP